MRRLFGAVLVAIGLLVLPGGTAVAAAAQEQDMQQCLDQVTPHDVATRGMPTCVYSDGHWDVRWNDGPVAPGGAGFFTTVLLFGLLWSTVPAIASYVIASRNGQSVGIAVLLGLLLGWIGLLIVYLMGREDSRAGAHNVVEALGPERPFAPFDSRSRSYSPPAPPATPAATRPPTADSITARLRQLDTLRARGVITEEEYASRRQAILDLV